MIEGSDYAQQTSVVNAIDDSPISEAMRLICYNQTIYNDVRLELNEYMGLTLGVRDYSLTRVLTFVCRTTQHVIARVAIYKGCITKNAWFTFVAAMVIGFSLRSS